MRQFHKFWLLLLFLIIGGVVSGVDVWDRPVNPTNVTNINITNNFYNVTQIIYYNDSWINQTFLELNQSINVLFNQTSILNLTLYQEISSRESNDTYIYFLLDELFNITNYLNSSIYNLSMIVDSLNNSIIAVNASIKQPFGDYLSFNSSNFWVNESALNRTINNISKIRKASLFMNCTSSGGSCSVVSSTNISFLITELVVTPSNLSNKYKSSLTTFPSLQPIDTSRATHIGVWDIEKNYGINSLVEGNITNALFDDTFIFEVRYLVNGVE